ncbi:MAG: riboflavin synthase [Actinomycetales bacterium]|nr:riboflavin synthase [Actinomycetales bacterium]
MFTGIIEELGEVTSWDRASEPARLTVRAPLAASDAGHGDSISVDGVCLTVVDQSPDSFTVEVMGVSIDISTLGELAVGDRVDLERAAALGHRLGGHLVQGHVDGTAEVIGREEQPGWRVLRFALDRELAPLVTRKGSIALDGVSLTVSAVSPAGEAAQWFEVSLIPETLQATVLGAKRVGDRVNVETDIVARQIARMAEFGIGGGEVEHDLRSETSSPVGTEAVR